MYISNNCLTGHLGAASSESASANGAEILHSNKAFKSDFICCLMPNFRGVFRTHP